MKINKTKMDLKIDSGAGINVQPEKYYKIKPLPKVSIMTMKLTTYNTDIPANIMYKNANIITTFIVTKKTTPLLDADTTEKLKIIKKYQI